MSSDLDRFTAAQLEALHDQLYRDIVATVDVDLAVMAYCNTLPYPSPEHAAMWARHEVLKARHTEAGELFAAVGAALRRRLEASHA